MKLKSILNHQSLHGRSSKVMLSWFSLLTPTPVAWLMAQSTYRQPMVFLTADGAMRSHMYTGDGPCMCLLVSFKHCFNQSRFNNHDQSQVSTQVSSNHDHCFNTGLNSTPLVQGAMVPTAKEAVEDEALPWAEPMEVVDEVLPWAETWQEEWQEGDEEGGSHGIHLRQETEEHKDTEAVVDLANEDEEEAEEESPEGETVHYYSAPAGIFVKIIEGQDGSLRRQEFVEDEEKWARANAAVRVWEFDFGRNTPLPALEMDVEEVPLEKDEEKDQQDRLKEKMKKKLGQTFLEKMKKKVAAERMAKKKEGRLQSLVKQTVAKTKKGSGKDRGAGPNMWWKKAHEQKEKDWVGGKWGLPKPPAVPAGNPGGQSSGSRDGGGWQKDVKTTDQRNRWKTDGGGWKKDGGGWKKDGGGWKNDGGKKNDGGWRKDGGWKKDEGGWKKDGGGWKKDGGGWKQDGGRTNDGGGWKQDEQWKNDGGGWSKNDGGGWDKNDGGGWDKNDGGGWDKNDGGGWDKKNEGGGGGWGGWYEGNRGWNARWRWQRRWAATK